MHRRTLLAMGSASAVLGTGGCLTDGTLSEIGDEDEVSPEWCPDDDDDDAEYRCGEGAPIDIHESFDDDEEVSYHDNGTVEWVYGSSDGSPTYTTAPFAEWADVRCPGTGARAAVDRTYDRLPFDREKAIDRGVNSGIGSPPDSSPRDSDNLTANLWVFVGDEEELQSDPTDLGTVVEAAPAYAETTITLADREHECTVPVYVRTFESFGSPD